MFNSERLLFKYANMIKNEVVAIKKNKITFNKFNKWALSIEKSIFHELDTDSIRLDWGYISNNIYAEVLKSLYDKNAYYKAMLDKDVQFQTAIQNIKFAQGILK